MTDNSNQDLKTKIAISESLKEEREISDERYAIKLVEKLVFAGVWIVLSGVVIGILALVIKQ